MNYYDELPNEYKQIYSIDIASKKTGIIANVIAFFIIIIVAFICFLLKGGVTVDLTKENILDTIIPLIIYGGGILVYMVIHELTHGLFYKIFTKKKLTFGITFSCAFCGVPEIYVKKKPMIITCIAPFVIYSIIFISMIAILPANAYCAAMILLFATHFGGCIGDLYVTILLLFKFPKDTLINDTGAKQTFSSKNHNDILAFQ